MENRGAEYYLQASVLKSGVMTAGGFRCGKGCQIGRVVGVFYEGAVLVS